MRRIIWHWTAGAHLPSGDDRAHYHYLIQGDGLTVQGKLPVSANAAPIRAGADYAAHTRALNGDSIGIALCGMRGAREAPFSPGDQPLTEAQITSLVYLTADLAERYRIPITRQTVLSHAEVQPTLGVRQAGKWDIAWLPGMGPPANPVTVGDGLRARVAHVLKEKGVKTRISSPPPPPAPAPKPVIPPPLPPGRAPERATIGGPVAILVGAGITLAAAALVYLGG